jgi:hypothetical protein
MTGLVIDAGAVIADLDELASQSGRRHTGARRLV